MRVVALSFACNNACIFCAQGKLRSSSTLPSSDAAVAEAVKALQPGETVALVGGEPTLDEQLPSFIRALDAAGAGRIVVQTNARRLVYRSYSKLLRGASRRLSLDVSLAGSTEAMHDYHTGTPGSFKQTVLGLRNARAEKIPSSISCTITRSNFRHLLEIVRLCHAVSATGVRFVPAAPLGTARVLCDRVVPAIELVGPYLASAMSEAKKLGIVATFNAKGDPEENVAETKAAYAGLGPFEAEPSEAAADVSPDRSPRRSLAIFGRPAPARREERVGQRKTGTELRTILPTLFDGSEPRDIASVVADATSDNLPRSQPLVVQEEGTS